MTTQTVGARAILENVNGYMADVDKITKHTNDSFTKTAKSSAGSFAKVGAGLTAGVTLPIIGAGAAAIKMGLDFENSFAEVTTLVPDMDEAGITDLREGLLGMSKDMGVATDKAIPALYQALSAGVPADNVISFLETANKAAVGGVTDLETAVDGITSVVNAYGSDIVGASKASDLMFTTVKKGKTTMGELSASLFNVIPTAASLGVSFEDVSAAMATMTLQGVPTSVATTQLRQALIEASKGGTKLDEAIKTLHGKSFAELIKEGKSTTEILDGVRSSMPEQEFKDLFGSVEALNAVLQITGPNAKVMGDNLAAMESSAGATDEAFKTMSETSQFKLNKAMNEFKIAMTELGITLLPVVVDVLTAMLPIIDAFAAGVKIFSDLPGPVKTGIIAFVALAAALGPVLIAISAVIGAVSTIGALFAAGGALAAIGPALAGIAVAAAPILAVVAAIAALALAAYLIYDNWDAIKGFFTDLWDKVKQIFGEAVDAIVGFVTGLFDDVMGFLEDNWREILGVLGGPFVLFATDGFGIRTKILNFVKGLFDAVVGFLKDNWREIVGILGGPFILFVTDGFGIRTKTVKLIKGLFKDAVKAVKDGAKAVQRAFSDMVREVLRIVEEMVKAVIRFFEQLPGKLAAIVQEMAERNIRVWTGLFNDVISIVTNLVTGVVNLFVSMGNQLINAVSSAINTVVSFFAGLPGRILSALGNVGSLLAGAGASLVQGLLSGAQSLGETFLQFFRDLPGKIVDALGSLGDTLYNLGRDVFQRFIDGLQSIDLPDLNPFPIDIPGIDVAGFAVGTKAARGGLAMVGEMGPELVNMPRGASVMSADRTASLLSMMAQAPGQSINVNVPISVQVNAMDWNAIRAAIHGEIDNTLGRNRTTSTRQGMSLGSGIG